MRRLPRHPSRSADTSLSAGQWWKWASLRRGSCTASAAAASAVTNGQPSRRTESAFGKSCATDATSTSRRDEEEEEEEEKECGVVASADREASDDDEAAAVGDAPEPKEEDEDEDQEDEDRPGENDDDEDDCDHDAAAEPSQDRWLRHAIASSSC